MPPFTPQNGRQSWFQLVFDGTSDLMSLHRVEPDGRLVFENVNPSLRAFHAAARPGTDATDWVGRDLAEVMSGSLGFKPAEADNILLPYREAVQTGTAMPVSHISNGPGPTRYREGTITPLKDPSGRVTHLLYRGADITDRRHAEAELQRSAARFSSLLSTSPVPISVVRKSDGVFLAVSDSWAKTVGYSRDEAVGRSVAGLDLWAAPGERERMFGQLRAEHPILGLETRFRIKSGEVRTFLFSASLTSWNDEPAIMAFPVDIEDIVRARARIEASEARLQEEQRLSRSMMDNTSDLMALYRIEGDDLVIEQWNRALRFFYARQVPPVDVDGWIGRPVQAFLREASGLDEDALVQRLVPYRRAEKTRLPVSYSMTIPSVHGPQHSESLVVPLTDAAGRVTHLVYRGTDVTSRKLAEEKVLRSAEQFAGMFNLVPNALAIVRRDNGRLLAVNDAWQRLFGWPGAAAVGRTALELGLWAKPSERTGFIADIEREGRLRPSLSRLRTREGREMMCLSSVEIVEWQGAPALLVSHQDISELEALRREALADGERFAKVFDLSPTPIVVGAVEDGRYLAVNDAWLQLHGYAREELEGQGSLSLGVWAEPAERALVVDMISRGIEVRRLPVRFRKKSGEVFETLYSATSADWRGTPAIIATPQDVTELRRAADEIRRLNETLEERVRQRTAELEAANRELESFSYSVSHDLRAPLRAMASFSALLAARPAVKSDAEATGYATRVNAAATRMGAVVDALLQFSRLSRQSLTMRPVDLRAEVDAVVAELQPGERRVRWVIGSLPQVRGDPTLLRLVLQNLIENAFKYTGTRTEAVIEVDATRGESETAVRVRDNGVGFEMQYADKIFGVFERLHADGEFEGTGIGLANARRIVQRHGGRIWCESEPGQGATFFFSLPD